MRRTVAKVVLGLAAAVVILTASGPAWACTCVSLTKPQLATRAQVIFTGKATSVAMSGSMLVTTFLVQTGYKGEVPAELTITSGAKGATCGYRFEQGARYTVFAVRSGGHLTTSLCSGTTVGDIEPAGYGLVPKAVSSGSPLFTIVIGAVLVGAAVWAFLRRRRDVA